MGTMTSFWDLGVVAAGPVSGAVAACASYSVAFVVAALVSLLAMALIWAMRETLPARADVGARDRATA
jgi:predicted MFS family arabinose efflux permease